MRTIGPVDWAIILWFSVGRGLLAGVVGPKPMVPTFIKDTLEKVGLSETWTRNVMLCIETFIISILWNGKKLDWIKPTLGIKQGDAISPYFFSFTWKDWDTS